MDALVWDRRIIDHYNQHFGMEPTQRYIYADELPEEGPRPITICEYGPFSDDPYWRYVTVGASRVVMCQPEGWTGPEVAIRMELLLYADQSSERLADALVGIASYPFMRQTFLAEGHTIPGSPGRSLIDNSPLTDLLFSRPYLEEAEFEALHFANQDHAHVLWVIPIYPAERTYKATHGFDALTDLFQEQETDTMNLRRPPVV
jgi:hypothetical protein